MSPILLGVSDAHPADRRRSDVGVLDVPKRCHRSSALAIGSMFHTTWVAAAVQMESHPRSPRCFVLQVIVSFELLTRNSTRHVTGRRSSARFDSHSLSRRSVLPNVAGHLDALKRNRRSLGKNGASAAAHGSHGRAVDHADALGSDRQAASAPADAPRRSAKPVPRRGFDEWEPRLSVTASKRMPVRSDEAATHLAPNRAAAGVEWLGTP
jgi:hypothetical protein